jgi:hypothetical protein
VNGFVCHHTIPITRRFFCLHKTIMFSSAQVKLMIVAALMPFSAEALEKCRPLCNVGDKEYLQGDVAVDSIFSVKLYVSNDTETCTMHAILTRFCSFLCFSLLNGRGRRNCIEVAQLAAAGFKYSLGSLNDCKIFQETFANSACCGTTKAFMPCEICGAAGGLDPLKTYVLVVHGKS